MQCEFSSEYLQQIFLYVIRAARHLFKKQLLGEKEKEKEKETLNIWPFL